MHTDHLVRNLLSKIQLMKGHDHSHLFFQHHFFQNGKQFQFMTDIQIRGWLIQDHHFRFLTDSPGKQHPLPLSITDFLKITDSKFLCMYRL